MTEEKKPAVPAERAPATPSTGSPGAAPASTSRSTTAPTSAPSSPEKPKFEPAVEPQPAEVKRGPGRPAKPKPETAPAPVVLIQEQHVKLLLDRFGTVNGLVAARLFKIPVERSLEIWKFSPAELDMLAGPFTAVANKYLPEWIRRHPEEFALILVSFLVYAPKVEATFAIRAGFRAAGPSEPPAKAGKTNGSGAEVETAKAAA